MSLCWRTASSRDLDTIMPGPSVTGPPTNRRHRAAAPAAPAASAPIATWRAVPVQREARCSEAVGKASGCSSSSTLLSWNSHSASGTRKRFAAGGAAPAPRGCPCAARSPSWSVMACIPASLEPRKMKEREHSVKPSSCTCTCVPNVMRPTMALSGRRESAWRRDFLSSASSSSARQMSTTSMYTGGAGALVAGSWYSIVV
mmetsp:Transcript_23676/g.51685  ORF Transcript_23676/g.51685 Transcript_23676/m.51685 type:complete len:201 (+) Transcript_23676:1548-2150(+)